MPASDPPSPNPPLVVLGGGLTGLAAAYEHDGATVLVEAHDEVGGHARTQREQGYAFDITGHFLHLRSAAVQAWLAPCWDHNGWVKVARRTAIIGPAGPIPYPFQANLAAQGPAQAGRCLGDYVRARIVAAQRAIPASFSAYISHHFGEGMAQAFFEPYNRKLWGPSFDQLGSAWMARFLPIPATWQVVRGAFAGCETQLGLGYNAEFWVHQSGGIDALGRAMAREIITDERKQIALGCRVETIASAQRRVYSTGHPDGLRYSQLISTLPLPELVAKVRDAPKHVVAAAARLRWLDWHYFDIALVGPTAFDFHWLYVPDPHLPFFRIGSYANVAPSMAPPGCSSLYVELAQEHRYVSGDAVIAALVQIGVIASAADVRFMRRRQAPYAYVVFDEHHALACAEIFTYLESQDIISCGRYGSWTYNSMEDCLLAGREAVLALVTKKTATQEG